MATTRIHMKVIGIKVGNNVFGYDPKTRTVAVRYKFRDRMKPQHCLIGDVSEESWLRFVRNPEAFSKLSDWMYPVGKILSANVDITFMGLWDANAPQLALPTMDLVQLMAA